MSLQDVFGRLLVEQVGGLAREAGFRRARRVWRRSSGVGDWVAFDVQSSQWNTGDHISCVVNLGAAPAPWLEFRADKDGRPVRNFSPSDGIFQTRLGPRRSQRRGEVWWEFGAADVEAAAAEIAETVRAAGLPLLEELLHRDAMTSRLRQGCMGSFPGRNPLWLAVVLADQGPSSELTEALEDLVEWVPPDRHARLTAWCTQRAESARA